MIAQLNWEYIKHVRVVIGGLVRYALLEGRPVTTLPDIFKM